MVNNRPKVLIIDDEKILCDLLYDALSERGYQCAAVLSGDEGLARLTMESFDVVLLDIRLPRMSGLDVLREIRSDHDDTVTIMITGITDIDTVVESMKLGALDYLVKPLDLDKVDISIRAALENKPSAEKSVARIDAVARGVEALLDPLSNYAKQVTAKTVEIARQLGISEEEIREWVAARETLDSRKSQVIKSALDKLG